MGSVGSLSCFDESSPCIEEQTSICVIELARSKDSSSTFAGQSTYVPWHICKDSGKSMSACHAEVGLSSSEVENCLNNQVNGFIPKYLEAVSGVSSLPREEVNGRKVSASYDSLKSAFCDADPGLSGCGNPPAPTLPPPTPVPQPVPSPIPSPTPSGQCHAISALVTDDWCTANCAMGFCPTDLCDCGSIMV